MPPWKVRCKATNRWGEPCKNWAMKGAVVCNKHGGMAPQVKRRAQERIMMAQDDAASLLVRFLSDDGVPYAERRRCAQFLLTYENRNEVKLMLEPWQEDLGDVVVSYEFSSEDVIEGEVVEDEPRAIPPSDHEYQAEVGALVDIADRPPKYPRGNRRRNR
jgi:hypothetical protein